MTYLFATVSGLFACFRYYKTLVSGKTFQCIFRHSVCRIADVTAVQEY